MNDIVRIAYLTTYSLDHMNRVYSIDGISPTITTVEGGNTEPKILVKGGRPRISATATPTLRPARATA